MSLVKGLEHLGMGQGTRKRWIVGLRPGLTTDRLVFI